MVEGTDGHPAHHQWPAHAPSKEELPDAATPKYQISTDQSDFEKTPKKALIGNGETKIMLKRNSVAKSDYI